MYIFNHTYSSIHTFLCITIYQYLSKETCQDLLVYTFRSVHLSINTTFHTYLPIHVCLYILVYTFVYTFLSIYFFTLSIILPLFILLLPQYVSFLFYAILHILPFYWSILFINTIKDYIKMLLLQQYYIIILLLYYIIHVFKKTHMDTYTYTHINTH